MFPHEQLLDVESDQHPNVIEDVMSGVSRGRRILNLCLLIVGVFTAGCGYFLVMVWWEGIGLWGENFAVNWAWDITNFVWWIGIGHAGTLISAILLLLRAQWRNSINRAAEAMTICAVCCSGLFILAHVGRPWLFYWVFPLGNTYDNLWVNFNSALVWDAFAILTYLIVSVVFWYLGLIPDMALLRDRSTGRRNRVYAILSFNWRGSASDWRRFESVMLTLSGLATALVISVHSIVAFDFATTVMDGWHATIFPPYFVIGAVFSGFAMVVTLIIPLRWLLNLEKYITPTHFEKINLIMAAASILIGVAYMTEAVKAFYMGGTEQDHYLYLLTGDYALLFYLMLAFNVALPQLLWLKPLRSSLTFSFALSIFINIGMWLERFVIIVSSLSHDQLPSSWTVFMPTAYDIGVFGFSIGLFLCMFLLFVRFVPVVSMWEMIKMTRRA